MNHTLLDSDDTSNTSASEIGRSVTDWSLAAVCAAASAILAFSTWDLVLSDASRALRVPGDLRKAIELSEAFAHALGAAAIWAIVLRLSDRPKRLLWLGIAITLGAGLTANLGKAAIVRIRPYARNDITVSSASSPAAATDNATEPDEKSPKVVEADFWDARQRSFPSGHAATAWGLALGLALVYPRAWWILAALACLASFQRVYCGAHYPSDVMAGAAIAWCWSAALRRLAAKHVTPTHVTTTQVRTP